MLLNPFKLIASWPRYQLNVTSPSAPGPPELARHASQLWHAAWHVVMVTLHVTGTRHNGCYARFGAGIRDIFVADQLKIVLLQYGVSFTINYVCWIWIIFSSLQLCFYSQWRWKLYKSWKNIIILRQERNLLTFHPHEGGYNVKYDKIWRHNWIFFYLLSSAISPGNPHC